MVYVGVVCVGVCGTQMHKVRVRGGVHVRVVRVHAMHVPVVHVRVVHMNIWHLSHVECCCITAAAVGRRRGSIVRRLPSLSGIRALVLMRRED